jgi:type II secretory ATPase GspE/PulE/Tfp pilus assembly ATPase PilB-like protein
MEWPLPSQWHWPPDLAPPTHLPVEVLLLDGQRVRGDLLAPHELASQGPLHLMFLQQPLAIPIAKIRSLTVTANLLAANPGTLGSAPANGGVSHEGLLAFKLVFVDATVMQGHTWGFVNQKPGGLFLYLPQNSNIFQALWIPRHVLDNVHFENAPNVATFTHVGAYVSATNMAELRDEIERVRRLPISTFAQAMQQTHLLDDATLSILQSDTQRLRTYIDAKLASAEMTELELEHARAHMLKIPGVNAEVFAVEPQALARLGWNIAALNSVVPLGMISGALYVASIHPLNRELQDRLGVIAGCKVVLVWGSKSHIERRLATEIHADVVIPLGVPHAHLQLGTGSNEVTLDIQALMASAQSEIKVAGVQIQTYAQDEHSSVVLLVKRMISDAYRQKASDIHIETNPGDQVSRVRFRTDGELEEYLRLPADLRSALVSRIKVMSKLDISERRRPQDGKINFADFSDIQLELRVAVLPTHDNLEDVVMRLLASSKPIALAQLGFATQDEALIKKMSVRPYGLILACGPTGSGKTTTLHSLLSEINTESRKIWTAEDPIEITQAGLRQLQVNPKIGVTFASAMRAFLRADPDVIMIGEVRDAETARISVEASLTGHLVMSTLHTNNAAESVVRLLDLGMDPMNFGDSLIGIIAQRLIRALCSKCKVLTPIAAPELGDLVHEYVEGTQVALGEARKRLLACLPANAAQGVARYRAVGCEACSGKGYKGRMGIYEILANGPELRHLIQTRAATSSIFEQAIASGTRSLRQDALEKVFAGKIDLEQARLVYSS